MKLHPLTRILPLGRQHSFYIHHSFLRCCKLLTRVCLCCHAPLQVAELATQIYITNDKPNVAGLVLSGSADFKTELSQSDMFDPRLQAVVLGVVDVSYGECQQGLGRSRVNGRVEAWAEGDCMVCSGALAAAGCGAGCGAGVTW